MNPGPRSVTPLTSMALTECFGDRIILERTKRLMLFFATASLPLVAGCGSVPASGAGSAEPVSGKILTASETKSNLRQLPYRINFRPVALPKGASAAVAERAIGSHQTVLNFGVALGRHPQGVPVPRAGTSELTSYPDGGFVYTDNLQVPGKHEKWEPGPQFHTAAQWREAGHMGVEIREKLCLAATGQVCPIGR